jgi:hypothetical protein
MTPTVLVMDLDRMCEGTSLSSSTWLRRHRSLLLRIPISSRADYVQNLFTANSGASPFAFPLPRGLQVSTRRFLRDRAR